MTGTPPTSPTSFAELLEQTVRADAVRAPSDRRATGRAASDGGPTWAWIQGMETAAAAGDELGATRHARAAGRRPRSERAERPHRSRSATPPPRLDLRGLPRGEREALVYFHARGETGLDARADHDEVRGAYRRLARRLHPDARGADAGDAGAFLELRRHYEALLQRAAA